MKVEDKILN